jgi:hypothetical protein
VTGDRHGQQGAQFVGDVGGKLAAGLLGSGQVGRHVVEGDGELAQLAECADPKSWPAGPRRRARGRVGRVTDVRDHLTVLN